MQSPAKNIDLEAHLETLLQQSRDHLLRQTTRTKPGSVMTTWLRTFLKGGFYIAAVLLVPGALIGAPILWWLDRRRKASPQSGWKTCS